MGLSGFGKFPQSLGQPEIASDLPTSSSSWRCATLCRWLRAVAAFCVVFIGKTSCNNYAVNP